MAERPRYDTREHASLRSYVQAPPDTFLFAAVAALVGIGLVMIFSASSATAYSEHHDVAFYLKRQFMWLAVGLVCAVLTYRMDYQKLRRAAPYILIGSILALVAVLVPHVGMVVNGARRWIGFSSVSFQPSEFAKLAIVVYLAAMLANRGDRITSLARGLFPLCIPVFLMAVLVLKEPDMGTASLLVLTAFAMFFAAGARIPHLAAIAFAAIPPVILTIVASPYKRARIFAFIDPWKDPQNVGFHIVQSLLALGSGGLMGVGLGASRAKFFYLPEQYTDFHLLRDRRRARAHGHARGRYSLSRLCLSLGEDRDYRAGSLRFLPGDRRDGGDYHSGAHQHRRRDVLVAGYRRAAAVHLLRRKLADRQSRRGRIDHERRPLPPRRSLVVNVVFAGGGTGGHLYPAIAIADALHARGATITFIGTADRLEANIVPQAGYELVTVASRPLTRKPSPELLRTGWANSKGTLQAARALARLKPDLVIATGGYVCFPVVLAARTRNTAPIALLEPNAHPGLTNRLLAPLVDEVWGAFADADPRFKSKYVRTGIPVRASLRKLPSRDEALARLGLPAARKTILAMGGSQGARSINDALTSLLKTDGLPEGWQLIHVTGEKEYDRVRSALDGASGGPAVRPYLHDLTDAYAAADLVLARAGASTLGELAAIGKPAVLVPYPHASDDHQRANAAMVAKEGAAVVVDDRELAAGKLRTILADVTRPSRLAELCAAAERARTADPVTTILTRVDALLERKKR